MCTKCLSKVKKAVSDCLHTPSVDNYVARAQAEQDFRSCKVPQDGAKGINQNV